MAEHVYLAVDLGASSGRVVAGCSTASGSTLEEVHRFDNGAGRRRRHACTGTCSSLWAHILAGLRAAASDSTATAFAASASIPGASISACSAATTSCSATPYHYRDRRTDGMLDRAFADRPARGDLRRRPACSSCSSTRSINCWPCGSPTRRCWTRPRRFLMMPDLFHWLLTGVKANEVHQRHDDAVLQSRDTNDWADELLAKLGLPTQMLGTLIAAGHEARPAAAGGRGRDGPRRTCEVVLPGTHDTASAVMAVPAASAAGSAARLVLHQLAAPGR